MGRVLPNQSRRYFGGDLSPIGESGVGSRGSLLLPCSTGGYSVEGMGVRHNRALSRFPRDSGEKGSQLCLLCIA